MDGSERIATDFGGIRRLEMSLPFHPKSVAVYLVPQGNGWILVDCGMNLPTSLPVYEAAGIQWDDIRQIILTHAHPDHSGLAARIQQLTGAPVRMHRREEGMLKSLRTPERWLRWQDEVLRGAGVPQSLRISIGDTVLKMRRWFPALEADSYIEDGDTIETKLGPMQAMLTGGHSAGHLCFYFPDEKILLSGDQLLKPRTPHLEWYPEGSSLAEFRASLEELAGLDVAEVLPSHGRPFREQQTRVQSILEHCRERAAQIRNLQARGVGTAHEMALALWNRPMSPFEHRSAVFEVLAFLEETGSGWLAQAA